MSNKLLAIVLFMLPLLCGCQDKEIEQPEICDSSCEEIKELESSINKVVFKHSQSGRHNFRTGISVTKTDSGAFAKYHGYTRMEFGRASSRNFEAELNKSEWLDFIETLYKCDVDKWEKKYDGTKKGQFDTEWSLDISFSDREETDSFSGDNEYPQNYKEFAKLMEDMRDKIKAKIAKQAEAPLENKLEIEYEKKFEEPISDFELSIKKISYNILNGNYISVARTDTGAIARDGLNFGETSNRGLPFEQELDTDEWLDFIRALRKCNIDKWEKGRDTSAIMLWLYNNMPPFLMKKISQEWEIEIFSSNEKEPIVFSSSDTDPSNWKDFKKIMNSMTARIKAVKKESDDKLKAEYQKRFGEPINDFEFSIRSISIYEGENYITVFRTATGAIVMYIDDPWNRQELDTGEWLDFIRTLHKCVNEWGKNYNTTRYSRYSSSKWELEIFSLYENESNLIDKDDLIFGSNAYPPNWEEFKELIKNMATRAKKMTQEEIEEEDLYFNNTHLSPPAQILAP